MNASPTHPAGPSQTHKPRATKGNCRATHLSRERTTVEQDMRIRRYPNRVIDAEGRRLCPRCRCPHFVPGRIRRVLGSTRQDMRCRHCGQLVGRRDVSEAEDRP